MSSRMGAIWFTPLILPHPDPIGALARFCPPAGVLPMVRPAGCSFSTYPKNAAPAGEQPRMTAGPGDVRSAPSHRGNARFLRHRNAGYDRLNAVVAVPVTGFSLTGADMPDHMEFTMGAFGCALSILAALFLAVGLIPFLGWLNWFTSLPLSILGAIFSIPRPA